MSRTHLSKFLEVKTTPTSGLGVFALTPIPRGTRLFSEPPLLFLNPTQDARSIYPSSLQLAPSDRKWVLGLSTFVTRETSVLRWVQASWWSFLHLARYMKLMGQGHEKFEWKSWKRWSISENVRTLNAFRNNAFEIGNRDVGKALFRGISRVNHSCIPNSQGNFHDGLGRFNVHAIRDIGMGEEITVSYLHEVGQMREGRRERLRRGYGFECGCVGCDLAGERGMEGERRREILRGLLGEMAGEVGGSGVVSEKERKGKEVDVIGKFISTLEDQGVAGREVASLYFELSRLYRELGQEEKALRNAERGLKLDEACLGTDHPTYLESMKKVEGLRSSI